MKHFLFSLLSLMLALSCLMPMQALSQTPHAQVILEPGTGGNVYQIKWLGVAGRVYSIQTSLDLQTWANAPVIELGAGADIIWGFSPAGQRSFIRLKYSVATTYTQGAEGDIDEDGISNIDEVKFFGTDPFVSNDTDNDGYLNADETAQGTNPNNSTSKPFDPNNPPPANRYVAPLSWWVENKFGDTVERLNLQDVNQLKALKTKADTMADGSYDLPYLTIQSAVNAASSGEVIQVAPGTYEEAVDLTGKDVKLIGQRGSREETIIELYSADDPTTTAVNDVIRRPFGLKVGAGNTAVTVVSGITIQNFAFDFTPLAGGSAVLCGGGSAARLHNLWVRNCGTGIVVDGASPMLMNLVVEGHNGYTATDAGVRITGTSAVKAINCTIADNVPSNTTDGQVQVIGATAQLTMVNSIVHSTGTRAGGQIRLTSGGAATVTYSSVKTGFTGIGNLTPTDANTPQFNTAAVVGGQRRVLRASPCLDNGNPAGIPGYTYWTRLDPDGEARRRGFGIAARASKADIGADEFVSRLNFPKKDRIVRNKRITFSEVDEASDVAFLGQLPNGNAQVAVINDEVIEWDQNANGIFEETAEPRKNVVSFYEISSADGSLVSSSEYSLRRTASEIETTTYKPGDQEVRDPEGLAYDAANRVLLVTTSQTRVNRYRDCETTEFDSLVDPPSNDYEPRRNSMVKIQLDTNLVPTGKTYVDSNDGPWATTAADRRDMDAFATGLTTVSPVGYDSTKGLIETIKAQLIGNTALGASVKNTGVLIAINTSPKFGEPANGVTYQPGAGLPYNNTNGLGGASATGGWVLHLPANTASADFPYWTLDTLPAAGQEITGYKTAVGGSITSLAAAGTYYFKAWAYDASRNYGRGLDTVSAITSVPPIKINEINAEGTDWVEFFNPSGQAINIGGFVVMDEQDRSGSSSRFLPANTIVPARGFYTRNPFPFGLGGGSDNVRLFMPSGTDLIEVDNYQRYTRDVLAGNSEGRAWDGGPRGKTFVYTSPAAFKGEGGLYHDATGGTHQRTLGTANQNQTLSPVKFLQATHNHLTQNSVFLHYVNLGEEPATWRYSPKQQDFHPISVEGLALKSQSEIVVGLRSPLSNRTNGNAYAFVFSNASNQLLPAGGWTTAAGGLQSVKQLNLNGQGIRSIQWCPTLNSGAGAYLIIGGSANGGPLKNETSRQVFSLYRWDNITATPVRVVADLAPFAVRPEGVNVITLNGTPRVVFVEDRFKAQGYDTQNGVHWSLAELNLQ